jgi:hypothetical protein
VADITDGQIFQMPDGTIFRYHVDPSGTYQTADGTKYDLLPGFGKPDASKIPDSSAVGDFKPDPKPGDIVTPPPVPGGTDTPGKGVTAVNTAAMKTYAQNLDSLVADNGPLKNISHAMDTMVVKAGGFRGAAALTTKVTGDSGIRNAAQKTLADMVTVITNISDSVKKMSANYESAEEANKMSKDDYIKYLSQVSGQINGMGGGSDGSSAAGNTA